MHSNLRYWCSALFFCLLSVNTLTWAATDPVVTAIQSRVTAAKAEPGLVDFYAARGYAPVWTDASRREHFRKALISLRDDGLRPADYDIIETTAKNAQLPPAAQAELDVTTTRGALRALRHLDQGKVDPRTLDGKWNFTRVAFDVPAAVQALDLALREDEFDEMFERARPQHTLYKRLRAALQELQKIDAKGGWPTLPQTVTLKPGDRHEAVLALRERLRISGDWEERRAADPSVYDEELTAALKRFQKAQYLDDDGVVGGATRRALNVSVVERIGQLRVNLERARWLLGRGDKRFVLVDIAGYRANYVRDGEIVWQGRVQIGQPYRRTPSFESQITKLTLNPTWTVPPTVLRKDLLPKLRRNPQHLAQQHIRILDGQGREHAPGSVDLSRGGYILRQDAGPDNALGRVAIRFPNPYSVYIHDTPSQALFDEQQRAFSSGCIRVERAMDLAERLLADTPPWDRAALDAAVATGKTQEVILQQPVRLLITYWTVDVLKDGQYAFRPDIYARDVPVLLALGAKID